MTMVVLDENAMFPSHAYQIGEGEGKKRWRRSCQLVE